MAAHCVIGDFTITRQEILLKNVNVDGMGVKLYHMTQKANSHVTLS